MLTRQEIQSLIACELPEEQIKEKLMAANADSLTVELISQFIECLRETCAFSPGFAVDCLDCSGTGGSGLPHFNTSTACAFVLAAGGVKVAKFGNRAYSGVSGSFDLLSSAGIQPFLDFEAALEMLDRIGLVFLFAPQYYPGLAKLAPIRKSISTPTIFNAIGPLLHPYQPSKRVMGIANARVLSLVAEYLAALGPPASSGLQSPLGPPASSGLQNALGPPASSGLQNALGTPASRQLQNVLGTPASSRLQNALGTPASSRLQNVLPDQALSTYQIESAYIARSRGGLDEFDPADTSDYFSVSNGKAERLSLAPSCAGDATLELTSPAHNFGYFQALLENSAPAYIKELVCLNAGAGFAAWGTSGSIADGASYAAELIECGAAKEKFDECRRAYAGISA